MSFLRLPSLAALGLAAVLTITGCSQSSEPTEPAASDSTQAGSQPTTAEAPVQESDEAKQARENLDALVAAAGTDEVIAFHVGPQGTSIAVAVDPDAIETTVQQYRMDAGTTEVVGPEDHPVPTSFANTPIKLADVDLDALLSNDYECDDPGLSGQAFSWESPVMFAFCEGEDTPTTYWLNDLEPFELDVTDADSVRDVLDRMGAGSSSQITSMMIVQDGVATRTDGSEVRYSNIQAGFVDGDRVRELEVDARGLANATGRELDDMSNPFQLSEIDIEGLLTCSEELKANSGEPSGSVWVYKEGDQIMYDWRTADGSLYPTDANCQPV